jgi:ABC-type lipoprotein export system ATPase subunit
LILVVITHNQRIAEKTDSIAEIKDGRVGLDITRRKLKIKDKNISALKCIDCTAYNIKRTDLETQ